jgi:monoamine oxidase
VEIGGESIRRRGGDDAVEADVVGALDELLSDATPSPDEPFNSFLERSRLDDDAKRGITMYVEGFNAASKNRIGVAGLKRQQEAENSVEGDRIFRVLEGYDALPLSVYALLKNPEETVYLNTVVHGLRWRSGHVEIVCTFEREKLAQVEARCAIITIPLGVLQATTPGASISFDPELASIREAADRLVMGNAVRVTLRFRSAFWQDDEAYDNASFVFAPGAALPTWWTQYPVRSPVVTGWAGGPKADAFPDSARALASAIDSMCTAFGVQRPRVMQELSAWHFHDWRVDPFARGAYSYVPVGGLDVMETLCRPIEKTLFFAGEATDSGGHWGTVHGAIRSGERVSAQVLESR